MSSKEKLIKIALPLIIILTGLGITAALIANRSGPEKEIKDDRGALVRIRTVKKQDRRVIVRGTGTVQAAQEVKIIPQVSGRAVWISPSMAAGGFFGEGDMLFEIEDTDYRLALEKAEAARAKAEYELAAAEGRARVARMEWKRLAGEGSEKPNPLVLYGPQLKNARAELASADASIKQAELDLARTRIRAPFNCRVRQENLATGQYVRAGESVAVLAGTDTAEIAVPLPLEEIYWINIPRTGTGEEGASAKVVINSRIGRYEWNGRVVRSTGEVRQKSRMMNVVISVNDPYGVDGAGGPDGPSLATGRFVEVFLEGKMLAGVISVPRTAMRDNSSVWIMDEENRLRIRPVNVIRYEQGDALVAEGLEDGDRIVLASLSGAADGMKLRVVTEGN